MTCLSVSDKICFLQVKHPQDVLPPALGASMYAITCILSFDGLPSMVPPNDLSANRGSGQDLAEASKFSQGRRAGYIPPSGFLMSLLADRTHNAPSFQNSSNHPGGGSAHTRPSRAPVGRFDRSRRPFRNSGPGTSAPRSFKRQRDAPRWAGHKGSLLHASHFGCALSTVPSLRKGRAIESQALLCSVVEMKEKNYSTASDSFVEEFLWVCPWVFCVLCSAELICTIDLRGACNLLDGVRMLKRSGKEKGRPVICSNDEPHNWRYHWTIDELCAVVP